MNSISIRRAALLCVLVAAVGVAAVGALLSAKRGDARPRCTHGVSSVGPVIVRDGRIVGGGTTPHTEACLRGHVLGTVPGTWPS